MNPVSYAKKAFTHPDKIITNLGRRGLLNWMSDEAYIKLLYYSVFKKVPNLDSPKTFNEKLQWLKLYDRKLLYTKLVDKYDVKEYVGATIGTKYIIENLGVWTRFDEIDFDKLPDSFVLKCTHDSGGNIICKDKSLLDVEQAKTKINRSLKQDFYYFGREWPYKNVKPRIIAEKYMVDESGVELKDYKFFCFDGYVDCVMLCYGRASGDTKFYFFDKDWQLVRSNKRGRDAPEGFTLPRPKNLGKMFELAAELSKGMPFARIDFYNISGDIYFSEITFFPESGFDNNLLPEYDLYWGNLIKLPK